MSEESWLEVSLIVDGELAEAAAEVLARFAPGGVAIETTRILDEVEGEGIPVGPLRVCAYLPVNAELEQTRQRIEEALWFLGRIRPLPGAQYNLVQQADWTEAWKQHYQPIVVGRRLQIVPAWLEPPDPRRIVIHLDPGMAFGTGAHPTTRLCLELIETHYDPMESNASAGVIDIGCGSGILTIAALKLGASHALGVDTDPLAVRVTRENAAANGVADRLEVGEGSVAAVRAGHFSLRQAPLVIVNILAPVILRLFEVGLEELLAPEGRLILSGILETQVEEVASTARRHGLRLAEQRQEGDWVALSLTAGHPSG